MSMIAKCAFCFSQMTVVKSPLSLATVIVSAVVLSFLLHTDLAQADGSHAPSFAAPLNFSAGPGRSFSVAVGDLNHDGKADLAIGHLHPFDCCDVNVSVLLGNGDGTFAPAVNYSAGLNPVAVAVGDFNDDGNPDLVTGNANYTDVFSVLLGNGDVTFGTAMSFGANWTPDSLVTVDFNGDGKLDLAAASDGTYDPNSRTYTNGSVLVLLGNGDGTFQVPATYGVGLYPASVA